MTEKRRSVRGRLLDVGLWSIVAGLFLWRFGPQLMAAVGVGGGSVTAPAFQATTLDGETIRSEDLRGQVVLVNFWATWCGPCRLEMPGFERVYRDLGGDGFVILGLATDVTGEAGVRKFALGRGVTYPIAMATAESKRALGGYRGLPTSILIDRQGRIRYRITGFYAEPALRAAVSRLVREPRDDAMR